MKGKIILMLDQLNETCLNKVYRFVKMLLLKPEK